jgi:VanZ family protein
MSQQTPHSRPLSPAGGGERSAITPRLLVHALVFLVFLSLWTWKLLEPSPVPEDIRGELSPDLAFVLAKTLHAGGYAFLTVLAGTLPVPRRWQVFLVGLMVLHGAASEVAQYAMAVGRTRKVTDVLIDWAGVTAGVLLLWWWNRRATAAAS